MVGFWSIKEPLLASIMSSAILQHQSLEQAVAFSLATLLASPSLIGFDIQNLFLQCFKVS